MQEPTAERAPQRIFKAGQFWSLNVSGAAIGGAGAVILMLVMMGIVLWMKPVRENFLFAATLTLILVMGVLCFFSGNVGAVYPYAVAVDEKGLLLYAPLKKLYIPIEDVRDVRRSILQMGYVVRLRRRRRLIKSFVIHRFFGDQADPLANAIQAVIWPRTSEGKS